MSKTPSPSLSPLFWISVIEPQEKGLFAISTSFGICPKFYKLLMPEQSVRLPLTLIVISLELTNSPTYIKLLKKSKLVNCD